MGFEIILIKHSNEPSVLLSSAKWHGCARQYRHTDRNIQIQKDDKQTLHLIIHAIETILSFRNSSLFSPRALPLNGFLSVVFGCNVHRSNKH